MRTSFDAHEARALVELLQPERLTRVVDIGANRLDEPPYAAMLSASLCHVTGFEPQPEALAELQRTAGPHETYLADAVGDGGRHRLHLCSLNGFSSLLEPDPEQLALLVDFSRLAAVEDSQEIATTRLDDVAGIGPVDHLKIDVQGSELMVFRNARRVLAGATSIQTEVGFHRLYHGQPGFAQVDLELRSQGFVPHGLVAVKDWPLAPVQWAEPLQHTARHLVEADVLYVRDLARLEVLDDEQLRHLALVTHLLHGRHGVALLAVRELHRRGSLPAGAEQRYRELALAGAN